MLHPETSSRTTRKITAVSDAEKGEGDRRSRRQAVGRLIGVPSDGGGHDLGPGRSDGDQQAGNQQRGLGQEDRPPGERLGEAPPRAGPTAIPNTDAATHILRPGPAVEPSSSSKAATRAPAAPTACTPRRIRSGTSESTASHRGEREQGHSGGPEMGVAKATGEPGGGQQRDRQHRRIDAEDEGDALHRGVELDQDRGETERDDRGVRQRDPSGDRDRDPSAVTRGAEPIIAASVANGGARRAGSPRPGPVISRLRSGPRAGERRRYTGSRAGQLGSHQFQRPIRRSPRARSAPGSRWRRAGSRPPGRWRTSSSPSPGRRPAR